MAIVYNQAGLASGACSQCGAEATSMVDVKGYPVTYGCNDHPVIEDFRFSFMADRDGVETRDFSDGTD